MVGWVQPKAFAETAQPLASCVIGHEDPKAGCESSDAERESAKHGWGQSTREHLAYEPERPWYGSLLRIPPGKCGRRRGGGCLQLVSRVGTQPAESLQQPLQRQRLALQRLLDCDLNVSLCWRGDFQLP